ncbi:MAG: TonB-dependent receptor [Bacteroidetes bacterium]|nr:TonB-dependent receptor [Bacteroidota bacterium]
MVRLSTIFIITLLVFNNITQAQNGVIKGRVFNSSTNEPVALATIQVIGTQLGAIADFEGKFIIKGVQAGFVKLNVSSIGYEKVITEEFQVTNAKAFFIDIPLQASAVQLKSAIITASAFKKPVESPVSMRSLMISEIEKTAGANRDISKVIQALPGVASTVSYRNDIIVRGGGPSENRFYLDGVEIPNLNHFSTQGASGGPVGIINVDFIKAVDFYSGAFPSNRGNALSSVLEMTQVDGNKDRNIFKGSVGASDLALTMNGPLSKKTTYFVSVRRSYLQFLFSAIGLPFLPTYNDFQFKVKTEFNKNNSLTFIGLGALDQFKLNTGLKNPTESQQYILDYLPVNEQKNYTLGLVYRHFIKNGFQNWIFSRNYLNNRLYKYKNNDESSSSNKTLDYNSDEAENKFRFEESNFLGNFKILFGAGAEIGQYKNTTQQILYSQGLPVNINYTSTLNLFNYNIFFQASEKVFQDRLILSFGLRTDASEYSNNMRNPFNQLSPRFSLAYNITSKTSFNFNIGRFYQRPAYTTLGFRDNTGMLVNKENDLKYIRADHIIAGLEFHPSDDAKLTAEGFYKLYNNYPFSLADSVSLASKGGDYGTFGDEAVKSTSKGRAYGFELLARERSFKGFNIIVSYTFVRSEFQDKKAKYIPSAWDNRHIIVATVSRSLKRNWDIGLKWRYVGGTPYTPYDNELSALKDAWDVRGRAYPNYNLFNSERLNAFHQLDLRVDKAYYYKKITMRFYVDIQNAYNFKADQQADLVRVMDANGIPVIENPTAPAAQQRYQLKQIKSNAGTVLPTIGVIIEI